MRLRTCLLIALFAPVAWLSAATPAPSEGWQYNEDTMRLRIADASTWVSIARVNLKITDLALKEGRLTGKYDMEVPLFSKNNEDGQIQLSFAKKIVELRQDGGIMEGFGIKGDKTAARREVSCEIFPSEKDKDCGKIVLKIDTGDRVLTFNTTYAVEPIGTSS